MLPSQFMNCAYFDTEVIPYAFPMLVCVLFPNFDGKTQKLIWHLINKLETGQVVSMVDILDQE